MQAGFVRDHRDVNLASHPASLLNHLRRHGLLDELDALLLQPVDLADRLLFVLPTLVGVNAERLLRDSTYRGHGGLVSVEADLDFENGKLRGFFDLGARLGGVVDADGEGGDGRVSGVEAEVAVQGNAELLP